MSGRLEEEGGDRVEWEVGGRTGVCGLTSVQVLGLGVRCVWVTSETHLSRAGREQAGKRPSLSCSISTVLDFPPLLGGRGDVLRTFETSGHVPRGPGTPGRPNSRSFPGFRVSGLFRAVRLTQKGTRHTCRPPHVNPRTHTWSHTHVDPSLHVTHIYTRGPVHGHTTPSLLIRGVPHIHILPHMD